MAVECFRSNCYELDSAGSWFSDSWKTGIRGKTVTEPFGQTCTRPRMPRNWWAEGGGRAEGGRCSERRGGDAHGERRTPLGSGLAEAARSARIKRSYEKGRGMDDTPGSAKHFAPLRRSGCALPSTTKLVFGREQWRACKLVETGEGELAGSKDKKH